MDEQWILDAALSDGNENTFCLVWYLLADHVGLSDRHGLFIWVTLSNKNM